MPPCESCKKPGELYQENDFIIQLWERCNRYEREYSDMSGMPKRLKTGDILPVCGLNECSKDDLERVLIVESVVYPYIFTAAKERQEKNK